VLTFDDSGMNHLVLVTPVTKGVDVVKVLEEKVHKLEVKVNKYEKQFNQMYLTDSEF